MTPPGPVDLHDPVSLVAADGAALLPAAALAGALVRSSAEQLGASPDFDRPRAFVVVGVNAAVDAGLLTALIGDNAPAPVVAATTLPGWVGPLDIVVVFASTVDDIASAEAAAAAVRRGARVVVRAAAEGPVAAAAGPALIEPLVPVTETLAGVARLTVLVKVAAAAGLCANPDFVAAADQLDALSVACHPASEFFVNPALTLAEHLASGTPLLIGTDPVADALAAYTCRSLAAISGCAGASLCSWHAAASPPVLARAAAAGGSGGVFYDPYEDGTPAGQQIASVLVVGPSAQTAAGLPVGDGLLPLESLPAFGSGPSGTSRSALAAALELALPRAMCIGPEELPSVEPSVAASGERTGQPQRDAFTWTVAMMGRIDFATVYLGLLTGARPPMDCPDGLGRPGGAAQHLPAVGGNAWNERESGSWS